MSKKLNKDKKKTKEVKIKEKDLKALKQKVIEIAEKDFYNK